MTRLLHYGNKPVSAVKNTTQEQDAWRISIFSKPYGLWVSVEGPDDWHAWCVSEEFRDVEKQICSEVILKPKANVCRLTSADDLRAFTYFFGEEFSLGVSRKWIQHKIRWDVVAKYYDGITIAPYIWSERLGDLSWYYGWDCASGCIWHSRAVKEINVVPTPIRERVMEDVE